MKTITILIFIFFPFHRLSPLGVIDGRIEQTIHYAKPIVNEYPTPGDVEALLLEVKVIKSKLQIELSQKALDSFFEEKPYRVLKKFIHNE